MRITIIHEKLLWILSYECSDSGGRMSCRDNLLLDTAMHNIMIKC